MLNLKETSLALSVAAICLFAAGRATAAGSTTIEGNRHGQVVVRGPGGQIDRQFDLGESVVRETFLLGGGTVAAASTADRTLFWDLRDSHERRTLNERVYALSPDESLLVSYIPGKDGGLMLRRASDLSLRARLCDTSLGGPKNFRFSPDGAYLAVQFCTAYPLRDQDYPIPRLLMHARYQMRLFDVNRGQPVNAFSDHPSWIPGRFDLSGRYYYLENPEVKLDGVPWNEGLRLDLQTGSWEPTGQTPPTMPKAQGTLGSFDVNALVNGSSKRIARVTVDQYQSYEDQDVVGATIRATAVPEPDAPTCCLEFWQFGAEDSWPGEGGASCGHTMTAPYVDAPKGGWGYETFDDRPRYNDPNESQFSFYDQPTASITSASGRLRFETTAGLEKGGENGGTFFISGASAAFQWGFSWDLTTSQMNLLPLTMSVDPNLDYGAALAQSCFTGWSVQVTTPEDPCLQIFTPTTDHPANVGPFDHPQNFTAEVQVGPSFSNDNISGLGTSAFTVTVDGKAATVVNAMELSDRYSLTLTPPDKAGGIPSNGLYDLHLQVNPGTGGTNGGQQPQSVLYSQLRAADIVLVIDRTGSMGAEGYMEPAKNAAKQFISFMSLNDRVGVVSFNTSATVNFPLTPIATDQVKADAQAAIDPIYSDGSTSIGSGMLTGQDQLATLGDPNDAQAMVLMSDGNQNTPPSPGDVLPSIPEKTDIYTIALGIDNTNESVLQDVAQATGGQYFMAPGAKGLQEIYNLILGSVTGAQTLLTTIGEIQQGATVNRAALVDGTVRSTTFSVGWETGRLGLELQKPNGSVVDSASAAADTTMKYVSGPTYAYYKVGNPDPGAWTLKISGKNVIGSGTFTAMATAETDLKIRGHFASNDYVVGQGVTILTSLENGADPIAQAQVVARITKPSTQNNWSGKETEKVPAPLRTSAVTDSLQLFDDGAHYDGAAGDGVYGNRYLGADRAGSYDVRVTAAGKTHSGGSFQRTAVLNLMVSSVPILWSGRIQGSCTLNSVLLRPVTVQAWRDNYDMSGPPDYVVQADSANPYLYTYKFSGLPDGDYSVAAFADRNRNGVQDKGEPFGQSARLARVTAGALVDSVDISLSTTVRPPGPGPRSLPSTSWVGMPWPNPGRGADALAFSLAAPARVRLDVTDVGGRVIRTILNGWLSSGRHVAYWDGRDQKQERVANGAYLYRFHSDLGDAIRRMVILR